jgi:hypothetical protein
MQLAIQKAKAVGVGWVVAKRTCVRKWLEAILTSWAGLLWMKCAILNRYSEWGISQIKLLLISELRNNKPGVLTKADYLTK